MQETMKTAGKTARNRFEEEFTRINAERDERLKPILERKQQISSHQNALKEQRKQHSKAIEAIDGELYELKLDYNYLCECEQGVRRECKAARARVSEEAETYFREHHGHSWWWNKINDFLEEHPEVAAGILAKEEEGGEL